jgi:hypothetical protein
MSRPALEEDWDEARNTGLLPEISNILSLVQVFVAAPNRYWGLKVLRPEFVERFILPILRISQTEHKKWVSLFLSKHGAEIDNLPSSPVNPELWKIIVQNYPDLIPKDLLEDYHSYIIMTIAQPASLKSFNKVLKKSSDGNETPEVRHWLSVFDKRVNSYVGSGTLALVGMINSADFLKNGSVTPKRLTEMLIEQASLFLAEYENYKDVWNRFTDDLSPKQKSQSKELSNQTNLSAKYSEWQKTGRVVLERVAVLVGDLKRKNKSEHGRKLLPSTTKLELGLLPYPSSPNVTETENQCITLAKALEKLLRDFLTGVVNVLQWTKIAEDVSLVSHQLSTAEERLLVALHVGKLEEMTIVEDHRTAALNFVRIELAFKLIQDGSDELCKRAKESETTDELVHRLRKRVKEWQNDLDENIREKVVEWESLHNDLWKILMGEKSDKDVE